jgi:hypothetical protein
LDGQGGSSRLFGFPILIAKSDLTVLELKDPVVAEGHAEDVRGEIFQSGLAAADRLTVDDPVLCPGWRERLGVEWSFPEGVTELGAEDLTQSFDGDQELGMFGGEPVALSRQAAGRAR